MKDDQRKMVVVAPDPIRIEVPIFGCPVPTVTWIRCSDESLVFEDDRTKMESGKTYTKLVIESSNRSTDSGKYKLVLKNTEGQAECIINVSVYGKSV